MLLSLFSSFFGSGEKKRSLGRDYHPLCLKCQKCNRQLTPGQHAEVNEENEWGTVLRKVIEWVKEKIDDVVITSCRLYFSMTRSHIVHTATWRCSVPEVLPSHYEYTHMHTHTHTLAPAYNLWISFLCVDLSWQVTGDWCHHGAEQKPNWAWMDKSWHEEDAQAQLIGQQ